MNLVEAVLNSKVDFAIHQANCFHKMGAGIAKLVREQIPGAYRADCRTPYADREKLGTFSWCSINCGNSYVLNLYAQFRYGRDKRYTSYHALETGLIASLQFMETKRESGIVGFPYKMGCNNAGGDWEVVMPMILDVFNGTNFTPTFWK